MGIYAGLLDGIIKLYYMLPQFLSVIFYILGIIAFIKYILKK